MYLCGLWDRAGVPGENPLGHREHTQEAVTVMTGSDSAVRQRSYSPPTIFQETADDHFMTGAAATRCAQLLCNR